MAVLLASGEKGINQEITKSLFSLTEEFLLKTNKKKSGVIRIKFFDSLKYNKLYETSNTGRMRDAIFEFLMIQFYNPRNKGGIHFHIFNGKEGKGPKNNEKKGSPVDFFLNGDGEVFLANTRNEYTKSEATTILNSKQFFGSILREIKRCKEGCGDVDLF